MGQHPVWKGKPKLSPLDVHPEFLKMQAAILQGQLRPFEEAGIEIRMTEDGQRLKAKNPARLVRDRLRRVLKEQRLEPDYEITCRLTENPGVWGVWVKHIPRESAYGLKRAEASEIDLRRSKREGSGRATTQRKRA
jgi:hypothetical protein